MRRRKRKKKPVKQPEISNPIKYGPFRGYAGPLTTALSLLLVLAGGVYGLERLKNHVFSLPQFNPSIEVNLDAPPEWVELEGWQPRILSTVQTPQNKRWLDASLLPEVAEQLADSGWVSKVERVVQEVDGTIRVACQYRRPIAMILTSQGYVPVDKEGVRLPEVYDRVDVDSGWIRILGVETSTPESGRSFVGEDAVAAIRVVSLIFEREFGTKICGVDVSNFRGRRNKYKNHIILHARNGAQIEWGSAVGEEIEEPSAEDKIRNLKVFFQRGGPHSLIDVSVDQRSWRSIEMDEPRIHFADGSRCRD